MQDLYCITINKYIIHMINKRKCVPLYSKKKIGSERVLKLIWDASSCAVTMSCPLGTVNM